jgi:hypothetical protein
MPGTSTLAAEITHVSKQGFWLLLDEEELMLAFADFPWFKQATIEQLCDVERPSPDHLYWPRLDVDLSIESIRHPERFPLVAKPMADTTQRNKRLSALTYCRDIHVSEKKNETTINRFSSSVSCIMCRH